MAGPAIFQFAARLCSINAVRAEAGVLTLVALELEVVEPAPGGTGGVAPATAPKAEVTTEVTTAAHAEPF